jgi:hypothetical protein
MVVALTASIDEPVLAFLIVFTPFLLILGTKALAEWLEQFIKIRRGFFSVNWVMKNHQWRERLVKPKGNDVVVEGKPQPFINNPKYTAFAGSKKKIFFTRIGDRLRQIQIAADTDKDYDKNKGIPPENEFNDMLDAAEIAGSLLGLRRKDITQYLLYAAIIAAAGALILSMLNFNVLQLMDSKITNLTNKVTPTTDEIANRVIERLYPAQNISLPVNATIVR